MTVPRGDDVPTALAAMAAAVQAGDFAQAEALGAAASFPLALPKHTLRLGAALSEGAQATVYHAQYTHPSTISAAHTAAGSGWGEAMPVAVKRPRIRETADLERFRREVGLLAQLQHPGLVRLLGARMLPPGEAGQRALRGGALREGWLAGVHCWSASQHATLYCLIVDWLAGKLRGQTALHWASGGQHLQDTHCLFRPRRLLLCAGAGGHQRCRGAAQLGLAARLGWRALAGRAAGGSGGAHACARRGAQVRC